VEAGCLVVEVDLMPDRFLKDMLEGVRRWARSLPGP